jgi:hypothetical protein
MNCVGHGAEHLDGVEAMLEGRDRVDATAPEDGEVFGPALPVTAPSLPVSAITSSSAVPLMTTVSAGASL